MLNILSNTDLTKKKKSHKETVIGKIGEKQV